MNHIDTLEATSIYILREAYANFKNLGMLWSIGKDSTVLLWLVRKAFFGHVPFPLIHIDTHFKIPEMIEYRDRADQPMAAGYDRGYELGSAGAEADLSGWECRPHCLL